MARSPLVLLLLAALVAVATAQCTVPAFTSAPSVETTLQDRVSVILQLTSPGEVSCVVVPANAPAPTDVQVQSLQDSAGAPAISSAIQYARFPARFFHLSLASLAASTAYDVYCVAWDSTCLGVVSKLSVTTDANPAPCLINATAEPPAPTFLPKPESRIETGENAGVEDDVFQVTFLASGQHQNVSFDFTTTGHTTYCNFHSAAAGAFPLWSVVRGHDSCDVRFIARFNFTKALGECFTRTNTATQVIYDATVLATTNQIRGTLRGTPQTRTVTTAMRLRILIPLFVNVTSQVINVTGPPDFSNGNAVFLYELIEQIFDTNTYDTNLKIFTSLPWPYELIPNDALLSTDPQYSLFGLQRAFAAGLSCGIPGVPCHQEWSMVLRPLAGQCLIDATFNVTFKVNCSASYQGKCPGFPKYITPVVYRLATNDFCLKIVTEGEATATILPYDKPAFVTPAYNFIFNERAYFETNTQVAMALPVDHTTIIKVVVISHNRQEILLPADPRLHIFPVDSSAPGRLRFDFVINSGVITLTDPDQAQLVNLNATLGIFYQGLNSVGPHVIQLSAAIPAHRLYGSDGFDFHLLDDDTTPSTSANTFFFSKSDPTQLNPTPTPTVTPASTSSASASISLVVGATVGALVAVIVAALLVYRFALRRSSQKNKTSSNETSNSDSGEMQMETSKNTSPQVVFVSQSGRVEATA